MMNSLQITEKDVKQHRKQECLKGPINKTEGFADTADTTENDVEQHRKQECLKGPIKKRKALSDKKSNGHTKTLIKLGTKLSVKHLLNTCSVSYKKTKKKWKRI